MLGILFTFWVRGFLIYEQKGSFFLPRGTGIKEDSGLLLGFGPHVPTLLFFEFLVAGGCVSLQALDAKRASPKPQNPEP